ncbi:hypothetical protein [Haloarcula sediminis]|uniref:hypothetical protein n=1 Tax=Haloarcula sediminis TaxID=3111777 RepID=UPI002D78FC3D|nr:hypothetical protein [Haloarcula sp. CK38]
MRATIADLRPDLPYRLRHLVGPWLTAAARLVGQPEFRLRRDGYVGTVALSLSEFERELERGGFAWGPVSWYHQPAVGSDPNGSWTFRRAPLADRQLHVILTRRAPECHDIYAHWEYNWLRHPLKHARQLDIDREAGSAAMREWLDNHGVDYEANSRTRRKVRRAIRRVAAPLLGRETVE